MADTARTKAALATLLADNTSGAVSEQDVRDLMESLHPSFGSLSITTPAATTTVTPGTYLKAAGTTTSNNLHRVTMPANNRLTYTGSPTIHAHIACSLDMVSASNNQVAGFKIAKNDVVLDHSKVTRKIGTGTDVGATALHADTTLDTNDYIELWLTNETSTATITLNNGYLFFLGMFA